MEILGIIMSILMIDLSWTTIMKPHLIHTHPVKRFWIDRFWAILFGLITLIMYNERNADATDAFLLVFVVAAFAYLICVSALYSRN